MEHHKLYFDLALAFDAVDSLEFDSAPQCEECGVTLNDAEADDGNVCLNCENY